MDSTMPRFVSECEDVLIHFQRFKDTYYPGDAPKSNSETVEGSRSAMRANSRIDSEANKPALEDTLRTLFWAKNRIEGPLLLAQKQFNAIKCRNHLTPLKLSEVTNYATRIAGSVAAPPETLNIHDPVMHQAIYPSYHFLNSVSHEEMLRSRLWDIAMWGTVCFPPMINVEPTEADREMSEFRLKLTCPTVGATLHFQIDESPPIHFDVSKNYLLRGPKSLRISAFSQKAGYKSSRIAYRLIKFGTPTREETPELHATTGTTHIYSTAQSGLPLSDDGTNHPTATEKVTSVVNKYGLFGRV